MTSRNVTEGYGLVYDLDQLEIDGDKLRNAVKGAVHPIVGVVVARESGQADDGRGSNAKDPSEQPGTSAPELLPDREANVNGIAEGKALGP